MEEIDRRINRIVGQLKGIQKMVSNDRDCTETLQQISAVKKAIDGLTAELVSKHIIACTSPEKQKQVTRLIEQSINL